MEKSKLCLAWLIVGLAMASCSEPAAEQISWTQTIDQASVSTQREASPGFLFDPQKVELGPNVGVTASASRFERMEGELAIFSQRRDTFLSVLQPTKAGLLAMKPYGSSCIEHDSRAREYFLEQGLPENQIRGIRCGATVSQVGTREELLKGRAPKPELVSFRSVITRQVEGIRIPYSRFNVSFGSDGMPFKFHIDWRPIPGDVLAAAKALPVLAKQSGDLDAPEPIILHSPGYEVDAVAIEPIAAYQSLRDDGTVVYRNASGAEFVPPFTAMREEP